MRKLSNKILALCAMALCISPVSAQQVKDYGAVPMLNMTASARWAGMGEAGGVSGFGPAAIFDNPSAGLFHGTRGAAMMTFMPWQRDIAEKSALTAVAGMFMPDQHNALSIGLRLLTGPQSTVGNMAVKPYDFDISIAYARRISGEFGISATAHYIHSRIGIIDTRHIDADGFAFDLGALYTQGNTDDESYWSVGLKVGNLGPRLKYRYPDPIEISGGNKLPAKAVLGGSVGMAPTSGHELLFSADVGYQLAPTGAIDAGAGAEYTFRRLVSLRAGYRYSQSRDTGYATIGCGVYIMGARLDASWWLAGKNSPLRNTISFGLSVFFL